MTKTLLTFSLLCALSSSSLFSNETRIPYDELGKKSQKILPVVDTLSLKLGYANAFTNRTDDKGGVSNIKELDTSGYNFALRAVFNNGNDALLKPYIDFSSIIYEDRNFYIPSVGLRHDFTLDEKWIEPYLSFGAGLAYMNRKTSPVSTAEALGENTYSANLTLEGGVDFYLNKNWALDLSLRYDSYNIETVIGGYYKLTTLEDQSSMSGMLGLVYRFGATTSTDGDDDADGVLNSQDYCINTPLGSDVDSYGCSLDDDFDGVINLYDECKETIAGAPVDEKGCATDRDRDGVITLYDRCPGTLENAPVTECGCVPYKFDFALNYDYNKFKIEDMLQVPNFNTVEFLQQYPKYKVRITGFADAKGSSKNNTEVSRRRAVATRNFLINKGIDKSRIQVNYRGDKETLFDNLTEEHRAKNRNIFVEFYREDKRMITLKDR